MPIRGHSGVQGGAEVGCTPRPGEPGLARWEELWGFPVPGPTGSTASDQVDASAAGAIDVFWIVGGNFLETLAGASRNRAALARPGLRIHQDIVFNRAMLVEPSDTVLLLPATTRYEIPGGVTETSTERRIIFSPEIPGRRIGSARPEWEVFGDVCARVRPEDAEKIRFESTAAIRDEIARAIPLYAGIETLAKAGDSVQWGGATLYADGRFDTPDGRARFAAVGLPILRPREGLFSVSTRRGKQFNSMVQRGVDPLTGASRHDVLMSAEDAGRLSFADGASVRLVSDSGEFRGFVKVAAIKPGNLEVHWPEGLPLLSGTNVDPRVQRAGLQRAGASREDLAFRHGMLPRGRLLSLARVERALTCPVQGPGPLGVMEVESLLPQLRALAVARDDRELDASPGGRVPSPG